MKIEYMNDNKLDGIKYDFDLIRKTYTKLKCPKKVYNPNHIPYESSKWNIILSDRSRGKTTNILLFGLCMFWLYKNGICYIRNSKTMITQGNVGRLFNTIIEWGYVENLTNGEYDGIIYKSIKHEWYFVKYNEDGEIVYEFESMMEAERQYGYDHRMISKSCKTGELYKGLHWEKI